MPESFLSLPKEKQLEVLLIAQTKLGRNRVTLEKDVWLCWTLQRLFELTDAPRMVFKGGTSLSKVFDLIGRFSEDVDVTFDYRSLLPDFDPFAEGTSKTKIKRESEHLRGLVAEKVGGFIVPSLQALADNEFGRGAVRIAAKTDAEWVEQAVVTYPTVIEADPSSYVRQEILLEFGGRNVTEPSDKHRVVPDIAAEFPNLAWPEAQVEVLDPQRTFWEKVTLAHIECTRPVWKQQTERFARHWYDLATIADTPAGKLAIANIALAKDVARHKSVFFPYSHANYADAVNGGLRLVPDAMGLASLEEDFKRMIETGFFFRGPPSFQTLIERVRELETTINDRK